MRHPSPSAVLAGLLAAVLAGLSVSCGGEGTAESSQADQTGSVVPSGVQGPARPAGVFHRLEVDWDGVGDLVSFEVLRPMDIPDEAELLNLSLHSLSQSPDYPLERDGIILAFYDLGEDGFLKWEQGWGMGPPPEVLLHQAVDHGKEQVGGYEVTWVVGQQPGGVGPGIPGKPDDAYIRVGWRPDPDGATGPGWKLTTDSLSRQQLFSIIESLTTQ